MSDGVFISDRPQLAIARQTVSFASLGLNDPTLTRIIYEVGNPYLSYVPTDEFNPISGITEGKSYLLYLNAFFDGSPALANAVLTNLIPQTTTNVFADERVVFLCTSSVSFATAGITTSNTRLITLVSEGYFTSYDPNDSINGIDAFVEGELYDIDPITDIDLHLYGVTKIRYSDEVLYLDSLEDVVVTNSLPDATLPLDQEEILVRNITTGIWENQAYDPGVPASDLPDGLISGGKVIWEGGLTFRVTAAVYYIGGVRYESAEGTITLDAADTTNPRFDIIALNTSQAIVKVTGTPSANPSEPQIDFSTQLYLTAVLVDAGATAPTGVTQGIIYDENTEWSHSTTGTISANFASTTQHSNGTVSVGVASWSNGATILFTNGSPVNINLAQTFSFKLLITAALAKSNTLAVQFFNGTTAVSTQVSFIIYRNTPGTFQTFSIDGVPFNGSAFDRVKFTLGGNSTTAIYIDEVRYQGGITQSTTETDPTVHPLIKQIPTSADASTNKYLNWNGSSYIRKQVDYSELTGTPSIPAAYTDEMAQDATAAMIAAGTHTGITFTYDDAGNKISAAVTGSGVNALAAVGSTPNANAATLSGSTLNLEPANSLFPGVMTTGAQTIAGAKTWSGAATFNSTVVGTGAATFQVSNATPFSSNYSTTNTTAVQRGLSLCRVGSNGANGSGIYIGFSNRNSAASLVEFAQVQGVMTNSTNGAEVGDLEFWLANGGTVTKKATMKGDGSFIVAEAILLGATVSTTNATPTNIKTLAITDETAGILEITLVGREASTGGRFAAKKIVSYSKDGGVLTLGTPTTVLANEATGSISTATWGISVVSNNVSIDVTGVAATNINWKTSIRQITY
jgi:hypothetical protein